MPVFLNRRRLQSRTDLLQPKIFFDAIDEPVSKLLLFAVHGEHGHPYAEPDDHVPPGGPLLWYPPLFSLQLFEQSSKKSIHTTRIELKLPRHVAHVTAFDFGIVPRAVLA